MLTIAHIDYIRKMYFVKGLSYTEIETRTGHNYRTIKKYIELEDFNIPSKVKVASPKSDLIRPYVQEILKTDKDKRKKYRHTAKRIFELLKEKHPDKCLIAERTMRRLVKEEREKLYNIAPCHLALNHPGGEAQVDFGEIYILDQGVMKKAHELVLSFPNSNAGFCQVTRSETMEALCEGLSSIFDYTGVVPNKIWFDQMAAACIRKKDEQGKPVLTEGFLRFALHYGFEAIFCNPNSGHEKGNVEKKVGYFRDNLFIPEPIINDLGAYNEELLIRCTRDNLRPHYLKTGYTIETLFQKETLLMSAVTKAPYDYGKFEKRRVNKQGYICHDGCHYSVSPKYVGSYVWIKILANELIIQDHEHRIITSHQRLFEKGKRSTHWADFIDVIVTRPRALKYSGFYSLLPGNWRVYTDKLNAENLKEALRFLRTCLLEKDMAFAGKVLEENLLNTVREPDALWTTYYRMMEDPALYHQGDLTSPMPRLPEYKTYLEDYNVFMGGVAK